VNAAAVPRWRLVHRAEVPPGDHWLAPAEQAVDASFTRPWRRADWRLGRFAAKGLVADLAGVAPRRVSVLAAPDGAPEAYVDAEPTGWSVSLSHRDGAAVALVARDGAAAGIDLEVVEQRSEAFVADWLHDEEQVAVAAAPDRDLAVVLRWSAKEAAAKARREGLRLDVRHAVVVPGDHHHRALRDGWWPLAVGWRGQGRVDRGWWRRAAGFVVVAVTDPDLGPPLPA
jgi:4'-phosphopantetheinyl transferase